MSDKQHPVTKAIHTQIERTQHREHASPLYLTSSFVYDDAEQMRAAFADEIKANIYSRFSNPNTDEFIARLCALEGTETGFATASGMGAIYASFAALLKTGDHILACRSIFGSTHTVLSKYMAKFGVTYSYVDIDKPDSWEAAIRPETKMIFVETPSNPGVDIIDLEWLGKLAERHHLILNVDNCFATPVLQRPADFGAHLVTHSATKFIDGQGRVLGGAVLGKKELVHEVYLFCRATGISLSPFNAWVLSKSLETLDVRMERHCANALIIASYLEAHPMVEWVKYPFLESHPAHAIAKKQMKAGGGIVTFCLRGGIDAGRKFLDGVEMASLTANLGDTKTIVTHPASTTHARMSEAERQAAGITAGLIRISAGLERSQDILTDLDKGFAAIEA